MHSGLAFLFGIFVGLLQGAFIFCSAFERREEDFKARIDLLEAMLEKERGKTK
jgi:hypothetical protein